jgi:isopentenyl-diphosphate Delta-isomerase
MWSADRSRTVSDGQLAHRSPSDVTSRKADHIRINLEEDVAAEGGGRGFDDYHFVHCALPELYLDQVDPSTEVFGRRLHAPLLISCMIGGTEQAATFNRVLAQVAQELHLAMGLGPGRILLEDPHVLTSFDVRRAAPDVLLFANLGAVQLNKGYGVDQCRRLVDVLRADALVLHLNALQEAVQPEGDPFFSGLLAKIGELCRRLEVPVVVKEVGSGIAPDEVRVLVDAGVSAVDVAGAGGTSWSEVERHRITEPWRARVASAFAGWGIPTAECVRQAADVAPETTIIASGGIRNGIDVAKAIALGAHLAGLAGPFLRAGAEGEEEALDLGRELVETLRIAMFGVGAPTLAELRGTPRLRRHGADREAPHVVRLTYQTDGAGEFRDITDDVSAVVRSSGARHGLVHVYATHTTAAIRINENEPLLLRDFRRFLGQVAPAGDGLYEHDDLPRRPGVPQDEPINGHAHCRHLLLSASETVPIVDGQLDLGRWQRIFLVELCSARERCVTVQVLAR